jgi:hypothetical protein
LVPVEAIVSKILFLRGEKVLLDRDLAELYGVETKQLKRAVRRNLNRFPKDFMFELASEEVDNLRRHFGTSSWGGTRYSPMAFTEQGVAMLSSVLNSDRAIEVNVAIMRAFVQLRMMIGSHEELARKLAELEARLSEHVLFLLYALCSMLYARPKALIGRRGRSGSRSARNLHRTGPGDGSS